ncbi:hypothetical protein [Acidovorax sp.]|uniref:hypothetical protein n=1 Tax=Acidovorax sp. TaxID=1872122 RepID=UPI0031D67A8F
MDDFDSGGWMNNMNQFGGWGAPQQTPTAQAANTAMGGFAPQQDFGAFSTNMTAPVTPTNMSAANTATANNWFGNGGSSPVADNSFGNMYSNGYAGAATATGDTRPMQVPNAQANPYATPGVGAQSAQGGQAANPYAGQPTPTGDPYQMLTNARLGADYQVPDWYRQSGLMGNSTPEAVRDYFQRNPQYLADWQNITSGGKSAFATDGSTLIRSNFNNMSPEAAAYYRANPDALLAEEGFGHDPTLAYMNYFGGAGSIGANNKTQSISTYLRDNRWTPQGISATNNPAMYARTPYGAGTASMQGGAATGSTRPQAAPGSVPQTGGVYPQPGSGAGYQTGGVYLQPGSGAGYQTGGVYPQPGGSSMSGSISSGPAGQNPFLTQMGDAMVGQMTSNLTRNVLPQLSSRAIAAGGMGGSRQGVIEANAMNDLNTQLGSALANLYGSGYNTALNYDLGLRNNDLGWGNLGLGYANLDRNINNDNNNWQLQGANLGLSLQDRLLGYGQLGLGLGTQINDNAYQNWLRFSQGANSLANGYGTSTGTQTVPGNRLGSALGGAQLGSSIGNWWGNQGWGTGNAYGNQDLGAYL